MNEYILSIIFLSVILSTASLSVVIYLTADCSVEVKVGHYEAHGHDWLVAHNYS